MNQSEQQYFEEEQKKSYEDVEEEQFQDDFETEDYFNMNKNNDQFQQVIESPKSIFQIIQPRIADNYLTKDALLKIIEEFHGPIQQLLNLSNPVLGPKQISILESYSNENANTIELDKLIEGLNQIYELEQSFEYLGILYFFIDYVGVGLITRSKFNKVCQNINDSPLGEREALITILISQLVFKKLCPLDQDKKNCELEEFFKMHQKGQSVNNIRQHKVLMESQVYDCLYVTLVLIRKEVWKQIFAMSGSEDNLTPPDNSYYDKQDSNLNKRLSYLHTTSKDNFKLLSVPVRLPQIFTDEQQNEQIIQLYSLIQTTLNELDIYMEFNILAIAIQEVFREQQMLLKDISTFFKDTYPQLKQQFAKQRQLQGNIVQPPPQSQQQQKTQILKLKTSFIFNEFVSQDEDQTNEFKNYGWPIQNIEQITIIQSVICSFLNAKGGYLYFGIHDQSKQVCGIQLSSKGRDDFKQLIQRLMGQIYPQKDMANNPLLQVSFIPIQNQLKKNLAGNFVVRVTVQQGELDKFYTYLNQDKKIIGTVRLDGQKQTYNYPEVADMIYKYCKNPRAQVELLQVVDPEPISDTFIPSQTYQVKTQNQSPNRYQQSYQKQNNEQNYNPSNYSRIPPPPPPPPQRKESDQATFRVVLRKEENKNRIIKIAKAVLGGFASEPKDFDVELKSDKEFVIIFKDKNRADKLQHQIMKQMAYLISLNIIKSIIINNQDIYDKSGKQIKKQKSQPQKQQRITFGFLKVEKSKKQNLILYIQQLLDSKKVKSTFEVRPFKHSVVVGFQDRYQYEIFILEVQQQESTIRRFGQQEVLMGGIVTNKIFFKSLAQIIQDSVMVNYETSFENKKDGSGIIECKNEIVAAEVYDNLQNLNQNVKWLIEEKIDLK